MSTLLHLDASPSVDTSISRALSAAFVHAWQGKHGSACTILHRDLAVGDIPRVDAAWIAAAFLPAAQRTTAQQELLAPSDKWVRELQEADEYVLGVPMYNFGIPAVLKLWIDQVVRIGETYEFDGKERHGLLVNKKAHVFVASGGTYEPGTPAASVNFVDPYLRAILGFMGVSEIEFYDAGGTSIIARKQQTRDEFLSLHLSNIK